MNNYNLKVTEAFLISQKAFIMNGEKLLLLQFPGLRKEWENKWSLPGGLLEMNEDTKTALLREIREETGLKVKIMKVVAIGDLRFQSFIFKDGRKLDARIVQIGYLCKYKNGDVQISNEHKNFNWIEKNKIKLENITPDSKDLIKEFLNI